MKIDFQFVVIATVEGSLPVLVSTAVDGMAALRHAQVYRAEHPDAVVGLFSFACIVTDEDKAV